MRLQGLRAQELSIIIVVVCINKWTLKIYILPNPFNLHRPIQQLLDVY